MTGWLRLAMSAVCAYCQRGMGERGPLSGGSTSHGICGDCLPKVNKMEFGDPLPDESPEALAEYERWLADVRSRIAK